MWRQIIFVSLCSSALTMPAFAGDYSLGGQDRVHIKVLEWRAGKQEYYEWSALTGDYTVNNEGSLSLPLLGHVDVGGKTTEQIAGIIADELQKKTGLSSKPNASVEVVQYRPYYILGDIAKPGEYAFRPELTVMKAVSLAGGQYRPGDLSMLINLRRDEIVAGSTVESSQTNLSRSLVRRARLQAELKGTETIALEKDTEQEPDFLDMVKNEDAILRARNNAVQAQRNALQEARELYLQQVISLEKKRGSLLKQIEFARSERDAIAGLKKSGLAVNNRVTSTERSLSELESRLLDVETAGIEAKQNANKTVRDELSLDTDRQARIISELQDAETKIEEMSSKLKAAQSMIQMTSSVDTNMLVNTSTAVSPQLNFTISRRGRDSVAYELIGNSDTDLLPGDVVTVRSVQSKEPAARRYESSAPMADRPVVGMPISARGPMPPMQTGD